MAKKQKLHLNIYIKIYTVTSFTFFLEILMLSKFLFFYLVNLNIKYKCIVNIFIKKVFKEKICIFHYIK